jgi:anti-sigma regulatory factor (Ser/Thr protein kinase)
MEVGTSGVLLLPYTASSVGVARRRLISDLTEAGVYEATACDAGLVLSELISNALRHATPLPGAAVRVSWLVHADSVEVAVSDGGGPTVPAVGNPGGSAIGGRGLGIVDRLSRQWGVRTAPDGARETTVWAQLALHCDGAGESVAGTEDSRANGATGVVLVPGLVTAATRDA